MRRRRSSDGDDEDGHDIDHDHNDDDNDDEVISSGSREWTQEEQTAVLRTESAVYY